MPLLSPSISSFHERTREYQLIPLERDTAPFMSAVPRHFSFPPTNDIQTYKTALVNSVGESMAWYDREDNEIWEKVEYIKQSAS